MVAHVVVENDSGHALSVTGCGSLFQIVLGNGTVRQDPAWPACAQPLTVPAGRSTYPVTVSATYSGCTQASGSGPMPACVDGGLPPLPPGRYQATLAQNPKVAPAPAPSTIQVTR